MGRGKAKDVFTSIIGTRRGSDRKDTIHEIIIKVLGGLAAEYGINSIGWRAPVIAQRIAREYELHSEQTSAISIAKELSAMEEAGVVEAKLVIREAPEATLYWRLAEKTAH
jgi:hypothetical protein